MKTASNEEGFELHPRLAADCIVLGDFPLCRLLLMNDRQYPWFILVPRRSGVREIFQLDETDQALFWHESALLSKAVMQAFNGHKLNVAVLGNMVPQLHIHHVVRYEGDPAWPAPVWGKLPALPYDKAGTQARSSALLSLLAAGFQPLA